ncbi:MAG TPA: translation elongation factor Ts [Tepidisphaeraceae bacterium]|jgi:elongation factor Ts|nr:translation elongation factor Ts [Tepidisphaeraceae bacterium]
MAEITAKVVNDLRAKTGLGMMECKKLLTEAGGDIEKAIDIARKKGVKTSIAERAASEGRVTAEISPDKKRGAMAEVVCNTDFTAKSEPVAKVAKLAIDRLLSQPGANLADDAEIKAQLTSVSQVTGENVQVGRTATLEGDTVGGYVYTTAGKGKIAVLMAFSGKVEDTLVSQLGMHIAAARPISHTRDQVPADVVARERDIAVEQAKATGKPQQIAEKIAEGKLNAFYGERVLLDQEFINAEVYKGKVSEFLKTKGAALQKYIRLEVGQA